MSDCASVEISVPDGVDDAPDIDAIVGELRELYCVTGLKLALTIGKLVLERIYGGDIGLWHSKGRKDLSFRKLAKHPALPFGPSTLSRAVGIYEISLRRLDLLQLPNVTSSHVRELLKLPCEQQDRLIDQTSRDEWSVRRLRDEIERVQGAETRVSRRVRTPRFASFLRTLGRGIEQVQRLTTEQTEELLRTARSLHQQTETVIEHLARHQIAFREGPEKEPKEQDSSRGLLVRADIAPRNLLPRGNAGRSSPTTVENTHDSWLCRQL
jgi:hypothetical protein